MEETRKGAWCKRARDSGITASVSLVFSLRQIYFVWAVGFYLHLRYDLATQLYIKKLCWDSFQKPRM